MGVLDRWSKLDRVTGGLWIAVELTELVVPWQGGCEGLSKIWTEDLDGGFGRGKGCGM